MAKRKKNPKLIHKIILAVVAFIVIVGLLSISQLIYARHVAEKNLKDAISQNSIGNSYEFDYGGSTIVAKNETSNYTFEEFGHGHSFSFPSGWQFEDDKSGSYDSNSMKRNSLKINDNTKILFRYFTKDDEILATNTNAPFVSSKDLIIDGRPAVLKINEGIYDVISDGYGYDISLIVSDVSLSKRVTTKELREFDGKFVMMLKSNEREDVRQVELNEEFRKVYETLKFK
jgi:hypothetical protein